MVFTEIEKEAFSWLPLGLNTLCDFTKQNAIVRPEGFAYHQILWVRKGVGTYRVGNESFLLSEGEGVFMRAHVSHSYDGEDFYTAWCTFSMSEAFFDGIGIGDYLRFRIPPEFNTETEHLIKLANGKSDIITRSTAGYAYVTELLSSVLSQKEKLSDKIYRILEQGYSNPLSLLDISEKLGMDRFSLCHIYKQERHSTIMDDLNRIRINKAKQLLKYNIASVNEIGQMCGFESSSYFCKRFRETIGCTPTEYRNKYL